MNIINNDIDLQSLSNPKEIFLDNKQDIIYLVYPNERYQTIRLAITAIKKIMINMKLIKYS